MGFDSWLIHTCTIERPNETLDAYRNAKQTWSTVATLVPCRFVEKEAVGIANERVESLVTTTYKLLIGAEADLHERYRISQVTLEDGTVIPDTFEVTGILARRARVMRHQTAQLGRVE